MEIQTQKRYNRITESCCIPYRLWELLVCAVCFGLAMAILFESYPSSMAKWMFLSTSFAFFLICFFDIIGYLIQEPIPGHSTWIMFCTMACFIFGTVSGIIIFQGIAKAPVILKVGLAFAIIAVVVFLFDLIHILCKLGRVPNNAVKEQKPKPKSVMKKTQVTPATSEEKFCRKCKKRCNIDETCSDPKCTTNARYRNANENIFEPEPEISKQKPSKVCSKFPVEPIEEEKLKPHLCDDPECPVVKKYKQMRQKQLEQQQEQEPEVGKNVAPIASSRPVMKIENERQQLPPKEINEPQKPTKKRLACESCNKPCNADTGSVCEEEECSERRRLKELQEFEQQLEDVMRKYTASLASSIPPAKQNQNISVRNVENQARIPVREDKERAFQNQRIKKFGSRDETTQFPPLQKHSAESTISKNTEQTSYMQKSSDKSPTLSDTCEKEKQLVIVNYTELVLKSDGTAIAKKENMPINERIPNYIDIQNKIAHSTQSSFPDTQNKSIGPSNNDEYDSYAIFKGKNMSEQRTTAVNTDSQLDRTKNHQPENMPKINTLNDPELVIINRTPVSITPKRQDQKYESQGTSTNDTINQPEEMGKRKNFAGTSPKNQERKEEATRIIQTDASGPDYENYLKNTAIIRQRIQESFREDTSIKRQSPNDEFIDQEDFPQRLEKFTRSTQSGRHVKTPKSGESDHENENETFIYQPKIFSTPRVPQFRHSAKPCPCHDTFVVCETDRSKSAPMKHFRQSKPSRNVENEPIQDINDTFSYQPDKSNFQPEIGSTPRVPQIRHSAKPCQNLKDPFVVCKANKDRSKSAPIKCFPKERQFKPYGNVENEPIQDINDTFLYQPDYYPSESVPQKSCRPLQEIENESSEYLNEEFIELQAQQTKKSRKSSPERNLQMKTTQFSIECSPYCRLQTDISDDNPCCNKDTFIPEIIPCSGREFLDNIPERQKKEKERVGSEKSTIYSNMGKCACCGCSPEDDSFCVHCRNDYWKHKQRMSAALVKSQRKQIPDSRHRSAPATTKELEKVRKQQPYYAAKKRNGLDSESSAGSIPDSINTDKQEREASPLFQQIPPNSSGSPSLGSISPKQVEYKSITSPSVKTSNYGQKSARSEPGKMKGCVCMNKYCPECATTTGMCTKYKKHASVPTSAQERANVKKDYRFQDTHLPGSMPD